MKPTIFCMISLVLFIASGAMAQNNALLWRVGQPNDAAAEFADYGAAKADIAVPVDWKARTAWNFVPKGLRGSDNAALNIAYRLAAVPSHGVLFSFKLLNAHKTGPEMAVFSNSLMAGLLQLWGTGDTNSPYPWRKTYRLYVPREFLKKGDNVLRLEAPRPFYGDASVARQMWWEWDYLQLEALPAPATEPLHGKMTYLGTTIKQSGGDFKIDAHTLALTPLMCKWLGIAYSGNAVRADLWHDVGGQQPERLRYLQTLRDLNMSVVADHVSSYHFGLQPDGTMPQKIKDDLKAFFMAFFMAYGAYFQFYELENEPTGFAGPNKWGGTHAAIIELAKYINAIKPPHVKTTAPGWAYWDKGGTPNGWERDPMMRRRIEDLSQAANGHSYGFSYADNAGGSFIENLKTYGGVSDGWPKPFVNTETGTNNWHSEQNGGPHFPSTQPHASAFDRIMRAHVAVVDYTMQHAAIFDDYGLFKAPTNWSDITTLAAYPGVEGEADNRLKIYRRLALAYATHGKPLPFSYLNTPAILGKKVLFRGVDTSTLAPLPGSGARSDKLLLNFVNFENTPQTMQVRVRLPRRGLYSGERIGAGDTYAASHSLVRLQSGPMVDLAVNLGPGEAVQYILGRGELPPPPAPVPTPDLVVTSLNWSPANPVAGDAVTWNVTIANRGSAPSPAGTTHGVKFMVDGKQGFWSDTHRTAIAPGAWVSLTANNGDGGQSKWTATAGQHSVEAVVDDVDRVAESDEANNKLTRTLTVAGG